MGKKVILASLIAVAAIFIAGYIITAVNKDKPFFQSDDSSKSSRSASNNKNKSLINPDGNVISTRINTPEGYKRVQSDNFGNFIRNLQVLPDKSKVMLYNGKPKDNQKNHIAVLSLDVGNKDLQQCADSAIRVRCEYLYKSGQGDSIVFHLTNGQEFPYSKYRDGYRLRVDGNATSLEKTAQPDNSYEAYRRYCDVLFTYAGSLSLKRK